MREFNRCAWRDNFARLATASGLSNLADGVFQITLPLVALGITRDPAAFASVTLVGRLPWLLFSLPAGALADRLDRRRTMTLVDLGRALLIGGLAAVVAAGLEELWLLYVVAFGLGVGETLFDTAAQSILPNVVDDPSRLSAANGRLYAIELTANQFVGPPLGGLDRRGHASPALSPGAPAAYALAAGVLLLLVGHFRPVREPGRPRLRTDIAEGVRYLARHRLLRTLAVCVGISNLASTATFAVFPLYAVEPGPMGLSGVGFGLLLTTLAVGSVIGSLVAHASSAASAAGGRCCSPPAIVPVFSLVPALTSSVAWIAVGVLRRQRADDRLERDHRLAAPAHRARPPARARQRRLPPAGLGHDAARCRARRVRRRRGGGWRPCSGRAPR